MEAFMKRVQAMQAELKAPKNRLNKFGGYNYRNTEDILKGVKPLLKKYGCTLTLFDEAVAVGYGEKARFYIRAVARLQDVESDAFVEGIGYAREAEQKKGMDESQITGTASSYARKYALNGLLCIDDGVDADDSDVRERLDEMAANIQCECCGKLIMPVNDGKRGYTPVQIAKLSQLSYGKDLCWLCAKEAKAEKEKAVKKGDHV